MKIRTDRNQKRELFRLMEKHFYNEHGELKNVHLKKNTWSNITKILNSMGPAKEITRWKKLWTDTLLRVRKKIALRNILSNQPQNQRQVDFTKEDLEIIRITGGEEKLISEFKPRPKKRTSNKKSKEKQKCRTCCIKNCFSTNPRFHLYRFPTNKNLRDDWIKACNLDYNLNTKNRYICEKHFVRSQIVKRNHAKGSIPHVYNPDQACVPAYDVEAESISSSSSSEFQIVNQPIVENACDTEKDNSNDTCISSIKVGDDNVIKVEANTESDQETLYKSDTIFPTELHNRENYLNNTYFQIDDSSNSCSTIKTTNYRVNGKPIKRKNVRNKNKHIHASEKLTPISIPCAAEFAKDSVPFKSNNASQKLPVENVGCNDEILNVQREVLTELRKLSAIQQETNQLLKLMVGRFLNEFNVDTKPDITMLSGLSET